MRIAVLVCTIAVLLVSCGKEQPEQIVPHDSNPFVDSRTQQDEPEPVITSFEECAKQYPVLASYPAQCKTPDGKSFTRDLSIDALTVTEPAVGSTVTSPIIVKGKARRIFNEAEFPVVLYDETGTVQIASSFAFIAGECDWMQGTWCPYQAVLDVPSYVTDGEYGIWLFNSGQGDEERTDDPVLLKIVQVRYTADNQHN